MNPTCCSWADLIEVINNPDTFENCTQECWLWRDEIRKNNP